MEGRKPFADLCEQIDDAKKEEHVQKLEEDCLMRLGLQYRIDVDDSEDAKKSSKKRKASVLAVEVIDQGDEL